MVRDLNDLQFFAAVVAHRGFSTAARALGAWHEPETPRLSSLDKCP
jgi:hypothetical protein